MRVQFLSWQPPRHPLLRLLLALAGVALLGFFTVFGLVVAAIVMAALGVRALIRQLGAPARRTPPGVTPRVASAGQRPPADGSVIEGEYRVVRRH